MRARYATAAFLAGFLAACTWSVTASATVVPTGATVKEGGTPVAQKTLVVTVTERPRTFSQTTGTPTKPRKQTFRVKTDGDGKFTLPLDDSRINLDGATIQITDPANGWMSSDIPLSSLPWMQVIDVGPPGTATATPSIYDWSGLYIGGQGFFSSNEQRIVERITGTDAVTNRLLNTKGMGGIGVQAGYDFGGWGIPGFTIGPVASFNYVGQSNNHDVGGGFFIGRRENWYADLGGRVAWSDWKNPNRMTIYALGGLELVNYDLQSNFTGPILAENHTATGAFVGGGVEYTRPDWRWGNGQWTTFGQATYSWFCGDSFRMPAFSPGFDYKVASNQLRFAGGFNFRFGAAPPPP